MMTRPAPMRLTAHAGLSVLACGLDDDTTIALADAEALLSPDEAARAARFRFPRDRDRFVRGRGFLRRELAGTLGACARALRLEAAPGGKPRLGAPGAPGFNLSHAEVLAVLALRACGGPIGIDLERCTRAPDAEGLFDTCLAPHEAAHLRALPAALRPRAFLACWTAKEAVMKLGGEGLARDPREILLQLHAGMPRAALAPAARLIALPVAGHVCHIALPPDASCAAATLPEQTA